MTEKYILGIEKCRDEIIRFNNDVSVQKLDNLYHSKSFSEILGVSRKEASHSNFLAWLLNDKENHSLSELPLRKFLEIVARLDKKRQFSENKDFFDSIIVSNYNLSDIEITKEKFKGSGRLDIHIEASVLFLDKKKTLRIIIENKVESPESNSQTIRYFKDFNTGKNSEIVLFVYLTPISNIDLNELEEPECASKEFIHINYQSILDYLLEPILEKDISDRTKMIINEYIKSLSQPTMNKNDNDHKPNLIMALGTEERNLLNEFWEKNQKIIMAALYARSIDDQVDEEDRDAYSNLLNTDKRTKDGMKIGEYVQFKFRELHKKGLLDDSDISNLQSPNYSKDTFGHYTEILRNANLSIERNDGRNGYYAREKFCGNYSLTSQWLESHWDSFESWLEEIYAKNGIPKN